MRSLILTATVLFGMAGVARAVTFSDASFGDACKEAKSQGKLVMVDFFATWCGPCKLLDEQTWPDEAVTKLVGERAVALRLDAEREEALARRYRVSSLPTILLLKPDGTELGRTEGFRDAKTFVAEFTKMLDGKDPLTRATQEVAAAGGTDPEARARLARALVTAGKYPEALDEYLWCFDHGAEVKPAYDTMRLMAVPDAVKGMARAYPPANEALETRVAAREALARAGTAVENAMREVIAINAALRRPDRTTTLFDSLPHGNRCRPILAKLLISSLVGDGRYDDVLEGIVPTTEFSAYVAKLRKEVADAPPGQRALFESWVPELVLRIGGDYFEALAGLRRDAEAREMAAAILAVTNTPEARKSLAERATTAKNPGVAP